MSARAEIATEYGMCHADIMDEVARDLKGIGYIDLMALFGIESPGRLNGKDYAGGLNIYGHDQGGIFSTANGSVTIGDVTYPKGSNIEVTDSNSVIFYMRIGDDPNQDNGMGPGQITYAQDLSDGRTGGLFRLMAEEGLAPHIARDNIFYSARTLRDLIKANGGDKVLAAAKYNGGASNPNFTYGRKYAMQFDIWDARLARARA